MGSRKNKGEKHNDAGQVRTDAFSETGLRFGSDSGLKGVALWNWDFQTGLLTFSPEWRRMMRLNASDPLQYVHDDWLEKVHAEDRKDVLAISEKTVLGEYEDVNVFFRMLREDGCWAWLLVWGRLGRKENGNPGSAMGTITDISALRVDAKFQHGNLGVGDNAYHAMLENSPDLLVRMDRELFPLYINPVVSRYMGRNRDEYTYSDTLEDLRMDPNQLAFLKEKVEWVFANRCSVRETISFLDAFGRQITGEYAFWPEFDCEGNVISAMSQFRDLTEQVEAEKSANHNARRLDALYRLSQMGEAPEGEVMRFVLDCTIELTGSQTGFVFIPHQGLSDPGRLGWLAGEQRFYGDNVRIKPSFLAGMAALGAVESDPASYRRFLNGDGKQPVIESQEGVYEIMRSAIVPVIEDDRIVCLVGVGNKEKDYVESDLQQLEMFISGAWLMLRRHDYFRELRFAKEAAEHANQVKDEFLANVSHELRTPLNGLLSMMQLMEYMPLSDEQREYIRAANLSGHALLRIISDILDYSRMAHGKMELSNEVFDLKQTIQSTLSLFRGEAEQKQLRFTTTLDNQIPQKLMGDDARVRQIVFNLVGNALKFTETGGITIACRLLGIDEQDRKVRVLLIVQDTGIGIPREQQVRIFEAFTQVDSSSTRKYAGTGLGLGIVKQLVNLMNGAVRLESEIGKGTSIFCELEFEQPALAPQNLASATKVEDEENVPLDILVAEDDSVSRFAINSFLKRLGHRAVCVDNGSEAIGALKLYPFHCLLTDIQMPDMDGMELAARIRENKVDGIFASDATRTLVQKVFPDAALAERPIDSGIAIIAVSAHAMAGDRERFLKRGMDDYISKPVVAEELAATLNRQVPKLMKKGQLPSAAKQKTNA